MANVPLQNMSQWSYLKTVEEASSTVSKWPEWKRERQLFSAEKESEDLKQSENQEDDLEMK